ncbi:hypothetical protein [Chamaesiphon sp.]|uniref:hypothetical protein n=1 Tax=Chamaesiphon sp. TaxID=2814140 RepID=UPI003593B712
MNKENKNWLSFDWDTNINWGFVNNKEKWLKIVNYYRERSDNDIYTARQSQDTSSYFLQFGFSTNHTGLLTLGEFFDTNSMPRL